MFMQRLLRRTAHPALLKKNLTRNVTSSVAHPVTPIYRLVLIRCDCR